MFYIMCETPSWDDVGTCAFFVHVLDQKQLDGTRKWNLFSALHKYNATIKILIATTHSNESCLLTAIKFKQSV